MLQCARIQRTHPRQQFKSIIMCVVVFVVVCVAMFVAVRDGRVSRNFFLLYSHSLKKQNLKETFPFMKEYSHSAF